jgi:DNA-directed RNA polymerase subunit RPC12/RpoP
MTRCSKCGRPLEDDELVAAPATDPEPAIEADTAVPDTDQPARCPSCGEVVAPVPEDDEEVPVKAPWHFKVLVVGTVVYLGYRLYQWVGWLIHHA